MNFVAPFKVDGKDLHIAISDSSKLGLMRNLKAITKKNIELHAAKVSQISEFIQKLQSETGEVTTEAIREERKEKTKTFDSDLGDAGEVLEEKPVDLKKNDYLLLFSWHISKELIHSIRKIGFKGKFIIPLPVPYVV